MNITNRTPIKATLSAVLLLLAACGNHTPSDLKVTPAPAEMVVNSGAPFLFDSSTGYYIDAPEGEQQLLARQIGFSPLKGLKPTDNPDAKNTVRFILKPSQEVDSLYEGYTLTVNADDISIESPTPRGLFYGLQTLCDLRESGESIAPIVINDRPRLPYRGMMIDVSRHFRSKEFVKKQIDAMARLKMNNLHIHLTDAAGWRLEIDKYPLLTKLGA